MRLLNRALGAAAGNGAASASNAWDVEYAVLRQDSSKFWDISTIREGFSARGYPQTGTNVFGNNPHDIFFKPDGTKMYVLNIQASPNGVLREFSLTTAWDIRDITQTATVAVENQDTANSGLYFKPDGTKFYTCGYTGDKVYEYDMTTAWDISTASYSQSFSVSGQEGAPRAVHFKTDGTKMYVIGSSGDDVNEYDLSTAWDVTTASYSQRFLVSSQESQPEGIFFKSDGLKMYIVGSNGDDINEYNLSTAWDVSTASYSQVSPKVSTRAPVPSGVYIKPDGSMLFISCYNTDDIHQFLFGVEYADTRPEETAPFGLWFKPDGTKMYIAGAQGDDIGEYDLSTAWDVTTASWQQAYSISSRTSLPSGVCFKPDGTAFYITDYTNDCISQYSLSTAWDVSTASYTNKATGIIDANPRGPYFKSDGTKLYCVGAGGDRVYEFDLSTAWDVSTAGTASQTFSVSAQTTVPTYFFFKSDGTRMYVCGYGGSDEENIYQYDLTTAWDISTASYSKALNVAQAVTSTYALHFKPDGTRLFVTCADFDEVTQWDITQEKIMYVKTESNEVVQYPYSIEQFRADNPTISFPSEISNDMLAGYGVYPVGYEPAPVYDPATQKLVIASQPSLVNGSWVLTKSIANKTAEHIANDTAHQALQMRIQRDGLLAATDWCALSDITMSAEMVTYRQALRDVPAQEGFPYNITWPTKPV